MLTAAENMYLAKISISSLNVVSLMFVVDATAIPLRCVIAMGAIENGKHIIMLKVETE
jgi:predicted homoserine dehydrogenase-like protein